MLCTLRCRIPTCIVHTNSLHTLPFSCDTHCKGRCIIQQQRYTYSAIENGYPTMASLLLKFDVQSRLLRILQSFQYLHRLMVLQHLYACHIRRVDVLCRNTITTVHKVRSVNVELINRLSIVLYLSVIFNLNTWQAFEHICNLLILCGSIFAHIICERITTLFNIGSFYYDIS